MTSPTTRRRVARVQATVFDERGARHRNERLAGEEPLEIRIVGPTGDRAGATVTMRTPGQDFALAAGLLFAEGVVESPADIAEIRYCTDVDEQHYNVVTVHLTRPPHRDLLARTVMATASCGVCGTASIDELCDRVARLAAGDVVVGAEVLAGLPEALRAAQPVFDETGGLHAAGLFDTSGRALLVCEDIGRHNALDKLLGTRFLAGELPAGGQLVALSGRISYELVQKAAAAGVSVLCAVSAPSSLAVATAERLGITLAGFVRDGRITVYTHPARIASPPA